ncbi:MAG: trypsin-like peptidase domain-containing protein [Lachnospiraceae bacterium]|nr:trypsin-like peptidase domain-containing protein [Lachnospiraceae bacterium]
MYNDETNYTAYNSEPQPQPQPQLTKKGLRAMRKAQRIERKASQPKKKNWFVRGIAMVVCAVLLGGVAGVACYGVSYAGYSLFPIKNDSQTESSAKTTTTAAQLGNVNANKDITATVYDVSDIVDSVISSVVAINGEYTQEVNYGWFGSQTQKATVSGSGIIIGSTDDELLMVTNAHVIDGVENLAVTFYDGSKVSVEVKNKKSSYDLAVISAKLSDIPKDAIYTIATLGDSSQIKVGEAAIAVGNSMGYGISVTTGCISALDKTVTVDSTEYNNLIQTDAAINPGNSGGALFNAQGEVIGINSVKMSTTGVEGMGYAISISSVKDIINELSTTDSRKQLDDDERGYLGITGVSITSQISQTYGYPVGVAIRSITKDGAADKAGLIKNDIICSFDGETVETIDSLVELMKYYAAGETVKVEYYHMNSSGEYEKTSTSVTLTSNPEK